jgi:hypothetical protein
VISSSFGRNCEFRGDTGHERVISLAAAASLTVALGQPVTAAEHGDVGGGGHKRHCQLDKGIEHIVYIQFDNVHFRRDNPSQKYLKFSDQAIWLSLSVG